MPDPKQAIKNYDTRIDRFRRREEIDPTEWADHAGMSRQNLARYRSGRNIRVSTAARIVRAARLVLGRPVMASEIFDVGEDEAVHPGPDLKRRPARPLNAARKTYGTPLDELIIREDVHPAALARETQVSRQGLVRLRAGLQEPTIKTLAALVRALRRMTNEPVRARHLYDVGEIENDQSASRARRSRRREGRAAAEPKRQNADIAT